MAQDRAVNLRRVAFKQNGKRDAALPLSILVGTGGRIRIKHNINSTGFGYIYSVFWSSQVVILD